MASAGNNCYNALMESQKYCTIYLVRHGEAQANVDKIVAGYFDTQLTPQGQQQARERGEHLKAIHFDTVFSSDLVRAKKTAELIAADRKLAVNTSRLLRERFFSKWEGGPEEVFLKENKELLNFKNSLTEQQKRDFKYNFDYESDNDIASRMLLFLREAAVTYLGKTILVVTHGSIMRGTLMHLGFAKHDELPPHTIDNTGYAVIECDGVDFFIKETNGIHKKKL